jgi:hypothetical protein
MGIGSANRRRCSRVSKRMPRSLRACAFLCALALLGACEDEARAKLAKGMAAEEVLAAFGNPPGLQPVDVKLGGKVHYIAPSATRTRNETGYAGFTVYFDRGKVWDWEIILLNPSYEPRVLPQGARSWQVRVLLIVLVATAAFFAVRYVRASSSRRSELLNAYAAREMPGEELPPDFRFLTHDTTRQALLDQAGPPSRITKLPLKDGAVEVLEYQLTNDAALFVMPEEASRPDSRIRAVVYRRPAVI